MIFDKTITDDHPEILALISAGDAANQAVKEFPSKRQLVAALVGGDELASLLIRLHDDFINQIAITNSIHKAVMSLDQQAISRIKSLIKERRNVH